MLLRKLLLVTAILLMPLCAMAQSTVYLNQKPATSSTLGGVICGGDLNCTTSGTISVPPATSSTLGSVKCGTNTACTPDGTLNVTVTGGGGGTTGVIKDEGGQVFNVLAYNAIPDGAVITGGITVASGQPTVHSSSYNFQLSDVGKPITIMASLLNTHSTSVTSFVSTIASVSGGVATMAGNSTFSASGTASARFYLTDNTAFIQAAINAANATGSGGTVAFPAGVFASGQLTFYSYVSFIGAGQGSTIVMLKNGANSDLFLGQNFAALYTAVSQGGLSDFKFEDMQLDGNRGANTGANCGIPNTGVGAGVRFYGYQFYTQNVLTNWFACDGWVQVWLGGAGSPINPNGTYGYDGMEAYTDYLKAAYNGGWGVVFDGPHDSAINNMITFSNGLGGINEVNGAPLHINHYHGYQEAYPDLNVQVGGIFSADSVYETGVLIGPFAGTGGDISNQFIGDYITGTLTLGDSGHTGSDTVYKNNFISTNVSTLINWSDVAGFWDTWVGGGIDNITSGMGYYAPNYSYGVRNQPDRNGLFPTNAFIMRQAASGQVFNSALQETSTGSERGIFSIQSAALGATTSTFLGSTTSANTSLTISVENNVGVGPIGATTASKSPLGVWGGAAIGSTLAGTTTAPAGGLLVQGTTNLGVTTTTLAGVTTGNALTVNGGHITTKQAAVPVASTCGSGTAATGSTDQAGTISGITAATACTLTFSNTWDHTPACVPVANATAINPYQSAVSVTAVTFTFALLTGSLSYICF